MFDLVKVTLESDKLSKLAVRTGKFLAKVDFLRRLSKETFQCERSLKIRYLINICSALKS